MMRTGAFSPAIVAAGIASTSLVCVPGGSRTTSPADWQSMQPVETTDSL